MSLIKLHERKYIRKTVQGADKTNLVVNVEGDSHYRVYHGAVAYHSAPPGHDYVIQPDKIQKIDEGSKLGASHYWNNPLRE